MNRHSGRSPRPVSVYRHNSRNEKGKPWQHSKTQIQTQVEVQRQLLERSQAAGVCINYSKGFYSTVYDLAFADCMLMKIKINVDMFSAS